MSSNNWLSSVGDFFPRLEMMRDNEPAALTANKAAPATAAKPSRSLTESLDRSDPA